MVVVHNDVLLGSRTSDEDSSVIGRPVVDHVSLSLSLSLSPFRIFLQIFHLTDTHTHTHTHTDARTPKRIGKRRDADPAGHFFSLRHLLFISPASLLLSGFFPLSIQGQSLI